MQRRDLPPESVRVVEMAAIAAARTIGQGERKHSDRVAVEAMRSAHPLRDHDHETATAPVLLKPSAPESAPVTQVGF